MGRSGLGLSNLEAEPAGASVEFLENIEEAIHYKSSASSDCQHLLLFEQTALDGIPMYSLMLSLTDPPPDSAIANGVAWMLGAALGTVATIVAVVAVATIGLLMLSGRLELRRGITLVLGCFILFGAGGIAAGLTGFAGTDALPPPVAKPVESPIVSRPAPAPPAAYDPYAGAWVPERR